ncbi:single-stranded DNA-binding protein [uncultured Microbacterium sp.]|uniref:single-stranded DNA-binding protein n=1 Tax=uncultured Microbacterium sp. TaxID=191216 RepID=UPI0025F0FC29|nr:single-stranded DNA-binding protein [uncultured Microbacterium sp.]
MVDTITVVGNVASPPEGGRTATGIETLTFRLASNHRRQDPRTGAWIDAGTNFYTVRAYRWLAENAAASLNKGDSVLVTGRLKLREWSTPEGKRGLAVEIEADSIGPDLRWGRSTFRRVSHQVPPEPERGGGSSTAATETVEQDREPVSVGAGSSAQDDWAPSDGDTPF